MNLGSENKTSIRCLSHMRTSDRMEIFFRYDTSGNQDTVKIKRILSVEEMREIPERVSLK